ncbi:MAG: type II secretion system protein [Gemmatimonadota bacterium]
MSPLLDPPWTSASARRGFTLIEVVVALVVAGILLGMAIGAFGPLQNDRAVASAQSAFLSLHAQTRAFALERGTLARLVVDAAGDRAFVTIRLEAGGDSTVNSYDFQEVLGVAVASEPASPVICMTPRGVANPICAGGNVQVTFTRGSSESAVQILPLGQVIF